VDGPLIRLLPVQRAIHPIRRAPLTGPPPQPPWAGRLKPEVVPEEDIPMTSETTAATGTTSARQNAAAPAAA